MTASPALAQPARELTRHHIGIQLGAVDQSSDVIALGNLGVGVAGITSLTILNYRYSLNPRIDLDLDARYWVRRWTTPTFPTIELTPSVVGPGLRFYGLSRTGGKRVIPYVQGNIYYVRADLRASERLIESGMGPGLTGGVDLDIGRLISIPIEAMYLGTGGGDAIDDLSGFGVSVGVNFNF